MFQFGLDEEEIELDLPVGFSVVFVGSQERGMVHLWIESDSDLRTLTHTFVLYESNEEISDGDSYVGSVLNRSAIADHHIGASKEDPIIWHVYEKGSR